MIILSIWLFWVLYWIFICKNFKQTFINCCWWKHSWTNYSEDYFILFLSFLPRELLSFPRVFAAFQCKGKFSKEGGLPLLSAKADFHKKKLSQLQSEFFPPCILSMVAPRSSETWSCTLNLHQPALPYPTLWLWDILLLTKSSDLIIIKWSGCKIF